MVELINSTRSVLQATYTPVKRDAEDAPPDLQPLNRAWDKWALINSLQIDKEELDQLREFVLLESESDETGSSERIEALDILARSIDLRGTTVDLGLVHALGQTQPETLVWIAERLIEVRRSTAIHLGEAIDILHQKYEQHEPREHAQSPDLEPHAVDLDQTEDVELVEFSGPEGSPDVEGTELEGLAKSESERIGEAELGGLAGPESQPSLEGAELGGFLGLGSLPTEETATALGIGLGLRPILEWHIAHDHNVEQARFVQSALQKYGIAPIVVSPSNCVQMFSQLAVEVPRTTLLAFIKAMKVEPIGYLHLERLAFTPAGIERGELVHSVPLAPEEEVNIAHKEWSNTSEEFERLVTDYMEEYSEEGVAEKSELAQAVNSQQQHSDGFNTGVTASGGYGPVRLTASVGYRCSSSSSKTVQSSRRQSHERTRKASSRSKKEHKMSFKVASASGVEEQAVRKIKNPYSDKAVRVDYYQLVRKWRVDLLRYGVRLTYDINIPEPGVDLLHKIKAIRAIDKILYTLQFTLQFDLKPSDINEQNWLSKAAQYGATGLPVPPLKKKSMQRHVSKEWQPDDKHRKHDLFAVEFDVDEDYEVDWVETEVSRYLRWTDIPPELKGKPLVEEHFVRSRLKGKSGKITLVFGTMYLGKLEMTIRVNVKLTKEAEEEWQFKAWSAIRDAWEKKCYELGQLLQQYRDRLEEELGAQDALSLRKIEREEVMKNVLRWMIGPDFDFFRLGLPPSTEGLYESNAVVRRISWQMTLAYGELIKFLHQAIEWENMIYFLYPYFWTDPSQWQDKLDVDHPDLLHRVFLKSGSARVVLPIRPGFEQEFTSLVELGHFGEFPQNHPYVTIAEEMRHFAQTNYPGIPAANPVTRVRPLLDRKQRQAWEQMEVLMEMLEKYKQQHGRYPNTSQGLAALQPYAPANLNLAALKDPWGQHEYYYKAPGDYGDYDLASWGDKGPQNDPDDAEITSWAEASLIGSWYEYTPTSALDIAFGETLPTA